MYVLNESFMLAYTIFKWLNATTTMKYVLKDYVDQG